MKAVIKKITFSAEKDPWVRFAKNYLKRRKLDAKIKTSNLEQFWDEWNEIPDMFRIKPKKKHIAKPKSIKAIQKNLKISNKVMAKAKTLVKKARKKKKEFDPLEGKRLVELD